MAPTWGRVAVAAAVLNLPRSCTLADSHDYGQWMGMEEPPSSDLITHHVRNAVLSGANVTAAQGSFEGPAVLETLFSTSSWPALTGIHLAVGMITLGSDGAGGCGVIPFHNHPNCYEVMTTISGYGAYGQIRPDGTTQWSRVLRPGDTWVMQQGSQHYYRNLNPDGVWQFEIAFTCSEVGSESMWRWIGYINDDLAKAFYPTLSDSAATELTIRPDLNLRKDSPRYIQNCVADLAFHENIRNDNDLYNTLFNFDEQQLTQPGLQTFTNAPFSNHPTWKDEKAALTLGYIRMRALTMMRPTVCSTSNIVYHILEGEAVVAQWTWDNKMAVDVVQAHDLVLVPIGSVHFIINPLSEPDNPKLRMMAHYDSAHNPPSLSVASNFFSDQDARVLEAVLKTSMDAATDLAGVAQQPQFSEFTGSLSTLKRWVRGQEHYRPLSGSSSGGHSSGGGHSTNPSVSTISPSAGHSSDSTNDAPGWLIVVVGFSLLMNFILAWAIFVLSHALGLDFPLPCMGQREVEISMHNIVDAPEHAHKRTGGHIQNAEDEQGMLNMIDVEPIAPSVCHAKVVRSWYGINEGDLSLNLGDDVEVTAKGGAGLEKWWQGRIAKSGTTGKVGVFPAFCVEEVFDARSADTLAASPV